MTNEFQTIPVRIYDREKHIVLAAPLPGLEAENISVTVGGERIVIRGEERGPRQHGTDVILSEWSIGPYYREISLQQPVKGPLTNATYGNGVLVLSMPKAEKNEPKSEISFKLQPIAATRGEWIGHIGSEINPSSS
jgi:HSP20 family protein